MTDWLAVTPPPLAWAAAARPVQRPEARPVAAAADSGDLKNDVNHRRPPAAERPRTAVPGPIPDRNRPTGPPPAFEANVLEVEAERRRAEARQMPTERQREGAAGTPPPPWGELRLA
ncbi:hypothetical protein, partial [Albidovulum sp.]